jgi:integrase
MRGSVYYQTAQLTKIIFQEGAKKQDRINPKHPHYQKIASYNTMKSYRDIWNNFFNYLREHWLLKDCEKINLEHIIAYIDYKVEYYPSKQYLQKIISALGKLEISLNYYSKLKYDSPIIYDFSIRNSLLTEATNLKLVADNYHNRTYQDPIKLIENLSNPAHQIAAKIELEGGARIEACTLIKKEQLMGLEIDEITKKNKGVIFTKEKGGKEGKVYISIETYKSILVEIKTLGVFKINRAKYMKEIRETAKKINVFSEGSHGLRWNFAQNRLFEYANAGYTYEQSLLLVSKEMKHNRASITQHYLGG